MELRKTLDMSDAELVEALAGGAEELSHLKTFAVSNGVLLLKEAAHRLQALTAKPTPREKLRAIQDRRAEPPKRAIMALHDPGHRIDLPGGYWLQKQDDNSWGVWRDAHGMPMPEGNFTSWIPVGPDGSIDDAVEAFADAMNGATSRASLTKSDKG